MPLSTALHDIGGEALAGNPADPRAHQLDRDHERCGEKYGPQQAVTKLRAGLRISRDARRVVVSGTGHQSRTKQPKQHVAGFAGLRAIRFGHEKLWRLRCIKLAIA